MTYQINPLKKTLPACSVHSHYITAQPVSRFQFNETSLRWIYLFVMDPMVYLYLNPDRPSDHESRSSPQRSGTPPLGASNSGLNSPKLELSGLTSKLSYWMRSPNHSSHRRTSLHHPRNRPLLSDIPRSQSFSDLQSGRSVDLAVAQIQREYLEAIGELKRTASQDQFRSSDLPRVGLQRQISHSCSDLQNVPCEVAEEALVGDDQSGDAEENTEGFPASPPEENTAGKVTSDAENVESAIAVEENPQVAEVKCDDSKDAETPPPDAFSVIDENYSQMVLVACLSCLLHADNCSIDIFVRIQRIVG